jgi:hypothetical protein
MPSLSSLTRVGRAAATNTSAATASDTSTNIRNMVPAFLSAMDMQ